MTWAEWVESSYNTGGNYGTLGSTYVYHLAGTGEARVATENGVYVRSSDQITAETTYIHKESSN